MIQIQMQRSLSLPGPVHASPRTFKSWFEIAHPVHLLFAFDSQILYTDLLNLQLYPPRLRRSLHDPLLRLLRKSMASLPDYIDTNPEVPIDPLLHIKSPQSEKGHEVVRGLPLHPQLLENRKQRSRPRILWASYQKLLLRRQNYHRFPYYTIFHNIAIHRSQQ